MSVLLSVRPEVQKLSVAPAREPDGAGLSGRSRVLERQTTFYEGDTDVYETLYTKKSTITSPNFFFL